MNTFDNKEKFDWKILFSIFLILINQIFAFIGGTVLIKTLFHVTSNFGICVIAIFYLIIIFMVYHV